MRVVIVGGGVLGTTSAYALLRGGADVTLVDRAWPHDGNASNVNAGLVSPGHAAAWATPRMLLHLPAVLAGRDAQLRVASLRDRRLLRWGVAFMRHCTPRLARRSTLLRAALGQRSLVAFRRVLDETGIECGLSHGILFVHASRAALERQYAEMRLLREEVGQDLRLIDREACLAIEPALAASDLGIAGGVYHPEGLSADCGVFTAALRDWCAAHGMRVLARTAVTGVVRRAGRVVAVETAGGGHLEADAFVVAAGAHTGRMLPRARGRLQVYPVRGYGLTWRDVPPDAAPVVGGVDEHHLVAWSRAGGALRVTGIAEFGGFRHEPVPRDLAGVRRGAERLFPWLRDCGDPHVGSGFRPVTPDGLPRIGRLEPNLYVNTGHGNLGWTLACGSADLLAAVVTGAARDPLAPHLAP